MVYVPDFPISPIFLTHKRLFAMARSNEVICGELPGMVWQQKDHHHEEHFD
jgi:hypothetical protein